MSEFRQPPPELDKAIKDPFVRKQGLNNAAQVFREAWQLAGVPEQDIEQQTRDLLNPERTRKEVGKTIVTAAELLGGNAQVDQLFSRNLQPSFPSSPFRGRNQ